MRIRNLETWLNLAILTAAGGVTAVNLYQRFSPARAPRTQATMKAEQLRADAQLRGKGLTLPREYKGGSAATAVLVLSKDCSFCAASAPFYRRLGAIRSSAPDDFGIAAYFPEREGPGAGAEYLAKNAVAVDAVQAVDLASVGVKVTPTLLLLDGSRKVVRAWSGVLSPDDQEKVISSLKGLCAKCVAP